MKKGVILLIGIVFVLSIVVVAFFGVSAQNITPVVYITSVEILDMDGNQIGNEDDSIRYLELDFVADIWDDEGNGYMQYFFNTTILPDNATYENILYSSNNSLVECTYAAGGGFLIHEATRNYTIANITCRSNDGGATVTDTIYLVVIYDN